MNLKIGTIIKKLRAENNITQDALATSLGVTPQAISRWESESGYPDIELLPALDDALNSFISMREIEGEALKKDILKKADVIENYVAEIKERAPLVAEDYRQRLTDRLNELLADTSIDEQRILTEVTIFADRACIDEEITRLTSHISQLRSIFAKDEPIGRKLDFLVQEMNREANTIASKSNDIKITQITVELKSEIEKIREQIQNIE